MIQRFRVRNLRRASVKELMGLPIEEVKRLKRTGEFYRRYPYFKRSFPTDAKTRLKYLRDLLRDEVEFEARYPAAYELLFGWPGAIAGLALSSFDARILKKHPGSGSAAGWLVPGVEEDPGQHRRLLSDVREASGRRQKVKPELRCA